MKLIVTEKPSVARDIAAVWGIKTKRDGYLEGRGCAVTWAFGHLVTLLEPGDYAPELKGWNLQTLPFIPEAFRLKLIQNRGVKEQFEVIQRLLGEADDIICATDAGREGELIFRYLADLAGHKDKPFRRLWLNSLTTEAVRDAFARLRDGHDYDALYAAARCRSESDWIVGLNATRCHTVRYGTAGGGDRVLWSLGRVQTPVLALIVERDDEIDLFNTQPFWELTTVYRKALFKYTGERFTDPAKANEELARIQGQPFIIRSIKGAKKTDRAPQLYDLTALQRDMNRRYNLSAAQTLSIAQSLYEQKVITYPRTDSRYITADIEPRIPRILHDLASLHPKAIAALDLEHLSFSKRITDNEKVKDHHAIIPTGVPPRALDKRAQQVYDAILVQLIAAFYPDCEKEITTVDGESNGVPFQAKGTVVLQPGWTVLFPAAKKKEEDDQELPAFTAGEEGPHEPSVREGKTKPPKHYTENSLLADMESAGKFVEDETLREALKERGIGTPATRAAIIETLLRRHYIRREKKTILATDMGRFLISLLQDNLLKSPEMTGEWEEKLHRIERGTYAPEAFMRDIADYTGQLVRGAVAARVDPAQWGRCPLCGAELIAGKKGIGCSKWKEGCSYVLWRAYKELQLSGPQARELLQLHVLLRPVNLPGIGPRALRLTRSGALMDVECPRREQQNMPKKTSNRPPAKRPVATKGSV